MSDGIETDLTRILQMRDDRVWSIVRQLADTPEGGLRRILRPHAEAGFQAKRDQTEIDRRAKLDDALERLTLFEIGREIGILTEPDGAPVDLTGLEKLFKSKAFLRYANAYLYFGVRLLAGRIAAPEWLGGNRPEAEPGEPDPKNTREFALAVPPTIGATTEAREALKRFLKLKEAEDARAKTKLGRALRFLDDFISEDEPDLLERWLRGLGPGIDNRTAGRFKDIAGGLAAWACAHSEFYLNDLDSGPHAPAAPPADPPAATDGERALKGPGGERRCDHDRPLAGWAVTNPLAARFGLADLYWIARLLRAGVCSDGSVSYSPKSWLELLALQARLRGDAEGECELQKAEEVLRSVFELTCDLVQNACQIAQEKEWKFRDPEQYPDLPVTTAHWRRTFDEELTEIEAQRARREFREVSGPTGGNAGSRNPPVDCGPSWSQRATTSDQPRNLIGLTFSGGGIRSATFNLGVLEGLQEFDLLRYVDYLSTVSGGGFIGSWLVANVKLTSHWLGRLTGWDDSVAHLRRYSNYLAPSAGFFSADTWTMWGTWLRNAFLIQLTGATWLAALLLIVLAGQSVFRWMGGLKAVEFGLSMPGFVAAAMALLVFSTLFWSLTHPSRKEGAFPAFWVKGLAVVPSWIGAFLIAALLWGETPASATTHPAGNPFEYSYILLNAWGNWKVLLATACIALAAIAAATMARSRWHALWIGPMSTAPLYLLLCAVLYLFRAWSLDCERSDWYAFVFGPALVLAAFTLCIVLFIGFCGRNSREWIREWWTRFGSWLGIYGVLVLAAGVSAVFGPLAILTLLRSHPHVGAGTVAGWITTVLGGLFAGNSSKTSGNATQSKAPWLEWLGKTAGFLFIVGAVFAVSTVVYALVVNLATNYPVSVGGYWCALQDMNVWLVLAAFGVAAACGLVFSTYFEINIFGLNQFYRNRLVRCYLGAARWSPGLRQPQPFTGFDSRDDMKLSKLVADYRGPFPILNCSLNLGGSSDLALHTRHSASFSMTPLRCGADRPKVGYAPTKKDDREFAGGVMLGQAVAISGAAASPNMGYNTSPLVAFLLTMFNVRLGWWFPNPGKPQWDKGGLSFSLYYLIKELFGLADETDRFVNVSDGGHFENLGVYELVRRRCKVIVASDAECDDALTFGSLGNLVRICETDFGAKIDIDVSAIRKQKEGHSLAHCTVGKITYSNGSLGYLIYLKASVTGDEDVGVAQYRSQHPSFPHETTADQFFTESQFESYRRLGQHVVRHALRGIQPSSHPVSIAEKLYDVWAPAGLSCDTFIKHAKALDGIWERFRQSPSLNRLMSELMGGPATANSATPIETCACLELIQLMENVFLDLRLDDYWEHPDNRGWGMLFMAWARSGIFRAVWKQTRSSFGIRFEYFCAERLGLERSDRVVRV